LWLRLFCERELIATQTRPIQVALGLPWI